jgi:hypothetical protein
VTLFPQGSAEEVRPCAGLHPDQAQRNVRGETKQLKTRALLANNTLLVTQPYKLAEILLRGSQLSVDRRKLRYLRLRKAVASGLEDQSVLSAKQPKRKNKLTHVNEAVEPDLPDEVRARLKKLREDEDHR